MNEVRNQSLREYLEDIENILPNVCRYQDLINIGIYSSQQVAYYNRKIGKGPPFFKLSNGIFYPKRGVIEFIKKSMIGMNKNDSENYLKIEA